MTTTPGFITHAPGFAAVIGEAPQLAKVVDTDAHEGPAYVADQDALYFTSLPERSDKSSRPLVAIRRLALAGTSFPLPAERVTTLIRDANAANGMTLDRHGRLIVCEQGGPDSPARITHVLPSTGIAVSVADSVQAQPLNSPNDVIIHRDGGIWFTDPTYGHLQGFRPAPAVGDRICRVDPTTAQVTVVSEALDKPNGIAFSPDESTLYVTDSGANQEAGSFYPDRPHQIVAFDVIDGERLGDARVLAVVSPGFPDGLKVDTEGRVYASSASGVQVFDAQGEHLGEITLPGAVNFAFGGPGNRVLFITTDNAIWAAILNATGLLPPADLPT